MSRSVNAFVLLVLIASIAQIVSAQSKGDFASLDFAAAAPGSYDLEIGGGAFNDDTSNYDTVESLQGGDYKCGDIVSFFLAIKMNSFSGAPRAARLEASFAGTPTSNPGIAFGNVWAIVVNEGYVVNGDDGTGEHRGPTGGGRDSWIKNEGPDQTTVTLPIEPYLTAPLFTTNSEMVVTMDIKGLNSNEQTLIRMDVQIVCLPNSKPNGNLQNYLRKSNLLVNGVVGEALTGGGAQTVNLKGAADIKGIDSCVPVEQIYTGIEFTADVKVSDPQMNEDGSYNGAVTGTFSYSWEQGAYRLNIPDGAQTYGSMSTFDTICTIEHDGEYRYVSGECGCEETFVIANQAQLFYDPKSDYFLPGVQTTLNGVTVMKFVQNPELPRVEAITELYLLPDLVTVVRAVWNDGRIMDFTNFRLVDLTAADFSEAEYKCICRRPQDLVILVQSSALTSYPTMIAIEEFLAGKAGVSGAKGFIDEFDISSEYTNIAIMSYDESNDIDVHTWFWDRTDTTQPFRDGYTRSNVEAGIRALKTNCGGTSSTSTCGSAPEADIVAGIAEATNLLRFNSIRNNVQKNILVITDGWTATAERNAQIAAAVEEAHNVGVNVFAMFLNPRIIESRMIYISLGQDPLYHDDYYVIRYNNDQLKSHDPIDIVSRLCLAADSTCDSASCCGYCDDACGACIAVDICEPIGEPNCNTPVIRKEKCCDVATSGVDGCAGNTLSSPCNHFECLPDGSCVEINDCVDKPDQCLTATCGVDGVCRYTPPADITCQTWKCVNGQAVYTPKDCGTSNECYDYTCENNVCKTTSKIPPTTTCQNFACDEVNGFVIVNTDRCRVETTPCHDYYCDGANGCQRDILYDARTPDKCVWEECTINGVEETVIQGKYPCPESNECYEYYCETVNGQATCKSTFLGKTEGCNHQECVDGKLVDMTDCPEDNECYTYECVDNKCEQTALFQETDCTRQTCVDGKLVTVQKDCEASDACYTRSCIEGQGCVAEPTFSATGTCNWEECVQVGGVPTVVAKSLDCSGQANDCFSAECVEGIGCQTTPLPDPEAANKCQSGVCTNGAWQYTATECESADKCLTGSCNPATGECTFEATASSQSCIADDSWGLCDTSYCDPATGDCVTQRVTCAEEFDCRTLDLVNFGTWGGCNPATGKCVTVQKTCTSPEPCEDWKCVVTSTSEDCEMVDDSRCQCDCEDTKCMVHSCELVVDTFTCIEGEYYDCSADLPNFCWEVTTPCGPGVAECGLGEVVCDAPADKCHTMTRDPSVEGCCVEKAKTCQNPNPDCFDVACDLADGACKTTSRCPAPSSPCEVVKCDPGCTKANPGDSCCKTSQVQCNNPPNQCYVGVCQVSGPNAGECRYDLIGCDDGDACTVDTCDPATGECTFETKNCDDGKVCTEDSCNATTGACEYKQVTCPDHDNSLCTTHACVPGVGCSDTPVVCDDLNPCTEDSCDPVKGCVYTPKNCDDGLLCTRDSCVNGQCVNTPKNCDDKNACTSDSCNANTGNCENVQKNCDDQDSCTNDSCGLDGECVNTAIVCNDNNRCTNDVCTGGKCVFTAVVCNDDDACTIDRCSLTNGECVFTAVDCDDGDACTDDTCENGNCVNTPIECEIDGDLCTIDVCVEGECVTTNKDCDDNDFCTIDTCTAETGACGYAPVVCNDGIDCTSDKCNPEDGTCVHTGNDQLCERNDACTVERCDLELGCVSDDVVCEEDEDFCTETVCKPFVGCDKTTLDCTEEMNSQNSTQKTKDNDCVIIYCSENEDKCATKNKECGVATSIVVGSAVGGAVIVGIVVAVVVALACAGGGVYAVVNASGTPTDAVVTNNPLYQAEGNGGDIPFYKPM